MDEQRVRLDARLYETRDTMRRLHGDDYDARIAEVRPYIEKVMEAGGLNEIQAATEIAKKAPGHVVAIIMATAVEMIEPSKAAR